MRSVTGGFFKTLKEYIMITVGMSLYVIGYTTFVMPHNILGGGVTGIATIIQYATGLKAGYSYFAINCVLLAAAFKSLGKSFGAKTVYAIIICSIGLNLCQDIIASYPPARQVVQTLAIDNGKLLSVIMAAIIAGVGMGMAISVGGSSGGTDILALIINKYRNITPGRLILSFDVIIITSSLLFPSHLPSGELMPLADKITTVVYGLIVTTICGNVVDMYLSGNRQSVQVFVFSQHYEELANAITSDLNRGVTALDGMGWYTKKDTRVLVIVARKTDLNVVLDCIKCHDPNAFVTVSYLRGVYGQGFDVIKK